MLIHTCQAGKKGDKGEKNGQKVNPYSSQKSVLHGIRYDFKGG